MLFKSWVELVAPPPYLVYRVRSRGAHRVRHRWVDGGDRVAVVFVARDERLAAQAVAAQAQT